ncbi:hypothetical protein OPEN69S_02005 [Ottowia pentelensis]
MIAIAPTSAPPMRQLDGAAAMRPLLAPLLAALLAVAAGAWQGWPPALGDAAAVLAFAGALAAVATTMLGFILAALAVVASVAHTPLMQRMRQTGHYGDLLHTMFYAGAAFLAIDVGAFALLFGAAAGHGVMLLMLGLHAAALVLLVDTGRKFRLVLVNL